MIIIDIDNHNHSVLHSRGFQVLPEPEWGEQCHDEGGEREALGGDEEGENCCSLSERFTQLSPSRPIILSNKI